MQNFKLIEKQNFNSEREAITFTAKNLHGAKIKASRMQFFKGTVLEITAENGATLAVKEKNGKWIDDKYFY